MEAPRSLQADVTLRGGPHSVRLYLAPTTLGVEVTAPGSAQRWRGDFDATAIEELTRRTGNFKQFGVFCSMLESALTQSSECVSLQLLTFADLQSLRSRRGGPSARPPPPRAASPLSAKRYLILLYSVQFDRIHYPLPLSYAGTSDPAQPDHRDTEIQRLRDELQRVLREQRATEATALRRLRDELQREKARHQREHRRLAAELAEAKASERRLQQRVKSLTAELASCRRGHRTPVGTASRPQQRRSASRESSGGSQRRPPSRSPSPAGSRPPRFDPTAFVRARQRRQEEAELKNQRRRAAFGSTSPARSGGRSSSAESIRSWRSAGSSGSDAHQRSQLLPHRDRRVTRTGRPLSALSSNSPSAAPRPVTGHKPPAGSAATKRPSKENLCEEPSAELANIDARLQALQEYMDSLATRM